MTKQISLLLILLLTLSSCSALDLASGLVGGGSNDGVQVDVDSQIGRENTRQAVVGSTQNDIGGDQSNAKVVAEEVTLNESPSMWFILLLVLGWLLPSPNEMARGIRSLLPPSLRSND